MTDLVERIRHIERLQPNGVWWPVTELLGRHDDRVTELLHANNELVTTRRGAIGRAEHFESSANHLLRLHHETAQRNAALELEASGLRDEVARMKADARSAWTQAHEWMLRHDELHAENLRLQQEVTGLRKLLGMPSKIVDLARAWHRSIIHLETARNIENNQKYTRAHLALKEELGRDAAMTELAAEGQKLT